MSDLPNIKIQDNRFAELISQVNVLQRLLYVPYAVFTCAAIGILYGIVFSLPIIWLPFAAVKGIVLVIMIACLLYHAWMISTAFIFTKHGISPYILPLATVIPLTMSTIFIPSFSTLVHIEIEVLDALLGYICMGIFVVGPILAMIVIRVTKLVAKNLDILIDWVSKSSQMELKQPFGEDFAEYSKLKTTLPDYFNDLSKVIKKRSSQNPFKQWLIKWNALLAGCGVIFYLPVIAIIAVVDLIWQLNLVIQRWGVYQILRITSPEKIKKGISSDTPSLTG